MSYTEYYLDAYDDYRRTGYNDSEFDFHEEFNDRGFGSDGQDYDHYHGWDDGEDDREDDGWEDEASLHERLTRQKRKDTVELFVLVIYVCDEYATIRPAAAEPAPPISRLRRPGEYLKRETQEQEARSRRFFAICTQLPMELQDRVCRLVYEDSGKSIRSQEVDAGITEVEQGFFNEQD